MISLYYIQACGQTNNIPVLYTSMRSDKKYPCIVYKHVVRQIISLYYIQASGPTKKYPCIIYKHVVRQIISLYYIQA